MYARSTEKLKVNLTAYNRQKEAALGLPAGTLAPVAASSNALAAPASSAVAAAGGAYGSANSLSYAKERPDDDAIDNVVRDMNEK
jgi:pre-mRNA-splicing factor SYF2